MILLTGATGYVGGRLLKTFEQQRVPVRTLARRPAPPTAATTESVTGDVLDGAVLRRAMSGVRTAYYLIHSMAGPGDFAERDRDAARGFGAAAREAGVDRIVYLGALGGSGPLSEHLASRQEVGRLLREAGVPVVEFRASIIVGAGSLSYEIVRALVDKLPVMVTPRWVTTLAQPISVDDVVAYLREAAQADLPQGGTFEIGGADRVSYGGIMKEYARQKGYRRLMIPVPVLTPGLSGLWLRLVAARHAKVGRALIEGVRNETVVQHPEALSRFSVRPHGIAESIRRALVEQPPETPALQGASSAAALAISLAVCLGAAAVARVGVLSVCYGLWGIAVWRVWRRDGWKEGRLALGVFVLLLALHSVPAAVLRPLPGLLARELLGLVTAGLFFVRSRLAGLLVLPALAGNAFQGP